MVVAAVAAVYSNMQHNIASINMEYYSMLMDAKNIASLSNLFIFR